MEELLNCKLHGLDVIELLSFFEREQSKLPLDILRPDWLIYSDGFERGVLRDVSKRAFDIIASASILCITWPFMLKVPLHPEGTFQSLAVKIYSQEVESQQKLLRISSKNWLESTILPSRLSLSILICEM